MAYLPKSSYRIQYTNGGEYILNSTKQDYIGKYILLSNGKVFAGDDIQNIQGTLTPVLNLETKNVLKFIKNNRIYSILRPKLAAKADSYQSIVSSTPLPTPIDYAKGIFTRYLAIKRNTKEIIEISKDTYDNRAKGIYDPSYSMFRINWSLKENNAEQNTKNLTYYNTFIKDIFNFFPDKSQYGLKNGIINLRQDNKRLYPDGEFIPSSLPAAYQMGNTDPQSKTNERVPNAQYCGNCVFFNAGGCSRWNASVKNNYWCLAWKAVGDPE